MAHGLIGLTFKPAWSYFSVRGHAYWRLSLYHEALPNFETVLEFCPNFHHTMCRKGECLIEMGHLDSAQECFQQALEYSEKNSPTWLGLARIAKLKQDREKFEEYFDKFSRCEGESGYFNYWRNELNG